MYLENAQRVFHAILHQSTVMQGNLFGIRFIGLLAELPAILDSFFTNTTSDYIGVVSWGWLAGGGGESPSGGEKHTSSSDTSIWTHWCCR